MTFLSISQTNKETNKNKAKPWKVLLSSLVCNAVPFVQRSLLSHHGLSFRVPGLAKPPSSEHHRFPFVFSRQPGDAPCFHRMLPVLNVPPPPPKKPVRFCIRKRRKETFAEWLNLCVCDGDGFTCWFPNSSSWMRWLCRAFYMSDTLFWHLDGLVPGFPVWTSSYYKVSLRCLQAVVTTYTIRMVFENPHFFLLQRATKLLKTVSMICKPGAVTTFLS